MDFFETVWNYGLFGYYGQNIGILFYVFGLALSAGLGYLAGGLNVTCFLFKFRFKDNIWEHGRGTYLVDMKREHGLLPVFAAAVGDIFKTLLAVFVFGILFGGSAHGSENRPGRTEQVCTESCIYGVLSNEGTGGYHCFRTMQESRREPIYLLCSF